MWPGWRGQQQKRPTLERRGRSGEQEGLLCENCPGSPPSSRRQQLQGGAGQGTKVVTCQDQGLLLLGLLGPTAACPEPSDRKAGDEPGWPGLELSAQSCSGEATSLGLQ